MIPPEYWRQLQRELNALNWAEIDRKQRHDREERERSEEQERKREERERRKRETAARRKEYQRQYHAAHREELREYQRKRAARLKAEKMDKSPKRTI